MIIPIFLLIISFFNTTIVNAETETETLTASIILDGYSYEHKLENSVFRENFRIIRRASDGGWVYCVQPFVRVIPDTEYEIVGSDFMEYTGISEANWKRIAKVAYYGYGYVNEEAGIDHTDTKWYIVTQMLIWRLSTTNGVVSYFTDYLGGPRNDSILINEVNELNNLVDQYNLLPRFDDLPDAVSLGDTITITDSNNVLTNYVIKNVNGGIASKNGNKLTITANDKNGFSLTLNNDGNRYGEPLRLYYSPNSQNLVRRGTIDPSQMPLRINVIAGKVNIVKLDSETDDAQGEASLEGAIFGIYNEDGTLVTSVTTDSNGRASTDNILNIGNYYVKEITAPIGYNLDESKHPFTINASSPEVTLNIGEDVIKGRIIINKIDSETRTCRAQGQASLKGAVFVIKDENGNIVDRITTDSSCTATSTYLPYGNYTIEEVTPSEGYYKNNTIYRKFISDNADYEITVPNEVIKNYINLLKLYDYVVGNTTIVNAEKDITFEIYYPASWGNTKYGEITTDKNGYAGVLMPYGVWRLHQVNTNTGFEKIYDFFFTVDRTSELEQHYNVLNNKISAYLKLFKIDSETNKVIEMSNVNFKILNTDTNEYVSQYVGGKVYNTFSTDESGTFTTYLKLEAGNYKIIEIKSPDGYLINSDGIDFTIGDNTNYYYSTYGAFTIAYFEDTPIKGQIEISKTGERFVINKGSFSYEDIKLKNVKFEIYADEDIKTSDGNYLYYNKNDLVEVIYTNNNGYAISKKLPLGKYKVVETATNDYHVLDTTEHFIELSQIDDKTPVVYKSLKLNNYLKKGDLLLTKVDNESNEAISNALFEVYTNNNELIFTGTTDENGLIKVENLKVGKYYITEKEAPYGYLLNNDRIDFEITENGEVINKSISNERVKGTINIHKNGESLIIDDQCDREICFSYDINKSLSDVEFELYAKEDIILNGKTIYEKDDLVISGTTDKDGNLVFDNLYLGKYYIKEKNTNDDYVLDLNEYELELEYKDSITPVIDVDYNLVNYLKKGTLSFSKIDLSTSEPLPNTHIEIYTINDELIYSGRTDETGNIVIENLKCGRYYIVEKEAPEGYVLNEEKMFFEILEDKEIIKSTMTNELIKVPKTLLNDSKVLDIVAITLIFIGIGYIIYDKNKRK